MTLKALRENPRIRLVGRLDTTLAEKFFTELDAILQPGKMPESLLLELSTEGGDADLGERLGEEIRLLREQYGITCRFLGSAAVYSAGITVMSAFPVQNRYLTRNTTLLVHERRLDQQVQLCGSLQAMSLRVRELLGQIEQGQATQERGFARLVEGSAVSFSEVRERAQSNWYLTAEEALERRLVAGLI